MFLTACGGGNSSNTQTVQGDAAANARFQIANRVGQDFERAKILEKGSGATLYDGQFLCNVNQTCTLGVSTTSQAAHTLELYNKDGDMVGAWSANRAPNPYSAVNVSHENLGAYLLSVMMDGFAGNKSVYVDSLKKYAASQGFENPDDILAHLGWSHHLYTLPSGNQPTTGFVSNVVNGIKNNQPSVLAYQPTAQANQSPAYAAGEPATNCSGLEHTLAGADGLAGIAEYFEIPYVGTVASVVGGFFQGVCQDTFRENVVAKLNDISSKLDDIEHQLSSIQLSQAEILEQIKSLAAYEATTNIQDKYVDLLTELKNNHNKTAAYLNILNGDPKNKYTSLADFFDKTGGLDADSLQGGKNPAKAAVQKAAVDLLNSLEEQKRILDALGTRQAYANLNTHLDKLCGSPDVAQGDIFQVRHMCNGVVMDLQFQVVSETTAAAVMLQDELAVLQNAKGKVNFSNPFASSNGADVIAAKIKKDAVDGVNLLLPIKLLDGFPAELVASIAAKETNCRKLVGTDTYAPGIMAWFPNSDPVNADAGQIFTPYVVTSCYASAGDKDSYSRLFYRNLKSVRNVMGVLVDGGLSYTGGTGYALASEPYKSTFSNSKGPTGEVDYFTYNTPGSYVDTTRWLLINNAQTLCKGEASCTPDFSLVNQSLVKDPTDSNVMFNAINDNQKISQRRFYSGMVTDQPLYAVALITDTTPFDSLGNRFKYLAGVSLNFYQATDTRCYIVGHGATVCDSELLDKQHRYNLFCLTQDCYVMDDKATLGYRNNGISFNMASPSNANFVLQVGGSKKKF